MSNFHSKWKQFLKEAQQDAKILRNINIKAIQKEMPRNPDEEMRDYFARIQGLERSPDYLNPIFPTELVDWMESLPDNHFPTNARKIFAKWLGNEVYKLETRAAAGWTAFADLNTYNNDVRYITDYINGAPEIPENIWSMDFDQVFNLSEEWHGTLGGDEAIEDSRMTRKVVYDFKNGYVIVDVPPQDLGIEGHILNHCVGGYCDTVEKGRAKIFSLRGPARKSKARKDYPDLHNSKNFPYATVEVDADGSVMQIKGNRNGIPKSGDAKMIKIWLRTTDLKYEKSIDYKNLIDVDDDLKPVLEGDGFVENYEDAIAAATHPDPEIHGYILRRFEEEVAKRGGTKFLDDTRAWPDDDRWVDLIMDELAKNNELEIPEIIRIAKLGYRVGIGSQIGPLLDPGSQQKYKKHHGQERNHIIARAAYKEMKDELLDPTPREDDSARRYGLLSQQISYLNAIARQDPMARQEIVDFLLSPEMIQRLSDTTRKNNQVIDIFDYYLMAGTTEYWQKTKSDDKFKSNAMPANLDTVKKIFDFQMSELREKLGNPRAPDRLIVRMAGLPKIPQEVVDYFVEYTANNTSGVNNSKITEKVIIAPSVSVEAKKELIKNSYMRDEQHLPKQGYQYGAYAKIFSRRLRELLFKVQSELAQWILDSGLIDPVLVEAWKGSIVRRTGRNVDTATLNSEKTRELEYFLKKQKKNIQRNINIEARKEKEKLQEQIQKYFGRERLTKNQFYNKIEETINEEKGRSRQRGIYKFYCMLSYGLTLEENKTRGLDDILADLRALPNVTIVTVVIKNQKITEGRYIAGLSVKFIPSVPGQFRSPEDVKSRIIRDIRRLDNVQSIFKVSAGLERLE
jgi:inhibitor of KinA sporulation pathway (predicted exonuclease)